MRGLSHPRFHLIRRNLVAFQSQPFSTALSTRPWKTKMEDSAVANKRPTASSTALFGTTAATAAAEGSPLCSQRGSKAVGLLPTYLSDARSVVKFSADNPDGALQLGVAESKMLEDLLVPMLNQSLDIPADCIYYQATLGRADVRESMASYMEGLLGLSDGQLDREGLVLGSGCNAVLENLCICLGDAGDAVLIPTPYYAAFEFDLGSRAALYVQPVRTQNFHGPAAGPNDPSIYYPTSESLDAAYEAAQAAGHAPKILLLSHPQNPLGICYPAETVKECVDWCRARQVHLISDEIYAGSVYRPEESGFRSILELAHDPTIGGLGPYVHWVYAMSKDFALSGLRVGAAYSENPEIRLPFQKLNDLCQISSQTQVWVDTTLRRRTEAVTGQTEEAWTSVFRKENHRRLRERCDALEECLTACGIPYLPPTAGLFCWVDLSAHLPATDSGLSESERERQLYLELVNEFGLLLTPGDSMLNEQTGFFRIVFTAATDEEFELGLERFRKFAAAKGTLAS